MPLAEAVVLTALPGPGAGSLSEVVVSTGVVVVVMVWLESGAVVGWFGISQPDAPSSVPTVCWQRHPGFL